MRPQFRLLPALAAVALLTAAGTADAQYYGPFVNRFPNPYTPYPVPYPFGSGVYWYNPALFYNQGYYGRYMMPMYSAGYGSSLAGGTSILGSQSYAPSYPVTAGAIRVALPVANARLKVNGVEIEGSTGYNRTLYVSDVIPGLGHDYTITAEWTQGGKPVTESRTVRLNGFGSGLANFFVPEQNRAVTVPRSATALTDPLRPPEKAAVEPKPPEAEKR
jgi:hypothetical protein